jgi:hypothetical protein
MSVDDLDDNKKAREPFYQRMLGYASDTAIVQLLLDANARVGLDTYEHTVMESACEKLRLDSVK